MKPIINETNFSHKQQSIITWYRNNSQGIVGSQHDTSVICLEKEVFDICLNFSEIICANCQLEEPNFIFNSDLPKFKFLIFIAKESQLNNQWIIELNQKVIEGGFNIPSFIIYDTLQNLQFTLLKCLYIKNSNSNYWLSDFIYNSHHLEQNGKVLRKNDLTEKEIDQYFKCEYDIIGILAHGEASHLSMGKRIICSALHRDIDNRECNTTKCNRIHSDCYKSHNLSNLRTPLMIAMTCHGFNHNHSHLSSKNSHVNCLSESYIQSYISSIDAQIYHIDELYFWVDYLSSGITLGELVLRINESRINSGRMPTFVLHGIPFTKSANLKYKYPHYMSLPLKQDQIIVNENINTVNMNIAGENAYIFPTNNTIAHINNKNYILNNIQHVSYLSGFLFKAREQVSLLRNSGVNTKIISELVSIIDQLEEIVTRTNKVLSLAKRYRVFNLGYYSYLENNYYQNADKYHLLLAKILVNYQNDLSNLITCNQQFRKQNVSELCCSWCNEKLLVSEYSQSLAYECFSCGPHTLIKKGSSYPTISNTTITNGKLTFQIKINNNKFKKVSSIYIVATLTDKTRGGISSKVIAKESDLADTPLELQMPIPENIGFTLHSFKIYIIRDFNIDIIRSRVII